MLRIIDRYLLRELVLTVLAVSAVLLLISIGETVVESYASTGLPARFPPICWPS